GGSGAEQDAAHRFAADVLVAALALARLLQFELLLHFRGREAGDLLDAIERPPFARLARCSRIGRLAVGLGAAAEAEEVVIELLVGRVALRPALFPHAAVRGPAGVHAVELAAEVRAVGFAGHDFIGVAREVSDAEVADALGLAPAANALPESRELGRVA